MLIQYMNCATWKSMKKKTNDFRFKHVGVGDEHPRRDKVDGAGTSRTQR